MRVRRSLGWSAALTVLAALAGSAGAADPQVSIKLGGRSGKGTPHRTGCTRLGGGNIDVQQPSPDTLVVTMSGVAVAYPHPGGYSEASFVFDLEQCFTVVFDDPKVKSAKLQLEGRVIGLLRTDHKKKGGSASIGDARACVTLGPADVASVSLPGASVSGGESLSINNVEGPACAPIVPGCYVLHQSFSIAASHAKGVCGKAASAEFAPDPALDPLWISHKEPFHGAAKKDFGFQITIRIVPQ